MRLRNLFQGAIRAIQPSVFKHKIEEIKEISRVAYEWLMEMPHCHWSKHAFDERGISDYITNSMTELFNS